MTGISPTGPGPHQVDASYPGDANDTASVSATTPLTVQVATPVISLASGIYTAVQTVTLTDATPGATIYYRTAGVVGSSGFMQYTGPITFSVAGAESIWPMRSRPAMTRALTRVRTTR